MDGFEAQQERTRPPLPTSPWKTGTRTPVSHSAHRPGSRAVSLERRAQLHPALIRRPSPAIVASLRRVITISGIGDHDPGLSDHDQRNTQPAAARAVHRAEGGHGRGLPVESHRATGGAGAGRLHELGGPAWPSVARLAAAAGLGRRTVQRALARLTGPQGVFLEVSGGSTPDGGRRASEYVLATRATMALVDRRHSGTGVTGDADPRHSGAPSVQEVQRTTEPSPSSQLAPGGGPARQARSRCRSSEPCRESREGNARGGESRSALDEAAEPRYWPRPRGAGAQGRRLRGRSRDAGVPAGAPPHPGLAQGGAELAEVSRRIGEGEHLPRAPL